MINCILQHYRDKAERKHREQLQADLDAAFNVDVKAGEMYIICSGQAVEKVNGNVKVSEILKKIEVMKESSKIYKENVHK